MPVPQQQRSSQQEERGAGLEIKPLLAARAAEVLGEAKGERQPLFIGKHPREPATETSDIKTSGSYSGRGLSPRHTSTQRPSQPLGVPPV